MKAIAACDAHLARLLRTLVPDDKSEAAKISNVATPSTTYTCDCGVPAHWFIKYIRTVTTADR